MITVRLNLSGSASSRVQSDGLLPAKGFEGSPLCGVFSP